MSRANYSDDLDPLTLGRWRGRVASATRGKRGQQLFKDLLEALDTMPEKRLIAHELIADGEVCALGACGMKRGLDMNDIDPDEPDQVAVLFDIAEPLAREVVYMNDENGKCNETPEERWTRMRKWVAEQIKHPQSENR
jgi:hypothetical protein